MNSKKLLAKLLLSAVISMASLGAYSQNLKTVGRPSMESPHANPIAVNGNYVYVTNTPAGTVDIIDRKTQKIFTRVNVGVDPVSIAVRPDGKEVWVSNHVSDSVSVIDSDPKSPTFHVVVATIQEFNQNKATLFDEPVGIAFASNTKAYVALSSTNQIAVIDVKSREITNRLKIKAQDPRAIVVRGDKLYVIPFESGNKTQLSGGIKHTIDGNLVTFDAWEHVVRSTNALSAGYRADIVKHPSIPDYDILIYDTKIDRPVKVLETLGTLLYGLTVDSKGNVFIAQTDARNDINGKAGTKKHGLSELQNRPYLNQITSLTFKDHDIDKVFFNLEPLPPQHPEKNQALATPYAIQISEDDSTIIASASASDKIFTLDARTGLVLNQITVGSGPRGIALEKGALSKAWVYNALDNSVSLIDVSNAKSLGLLATIPLEDPTHQAVKRGRIAFNTASASATSTFSCASCHPNGHTDQLLWILTAPPVHKGNQVQPRATMPVRGLRDTEPYHWDGTKGNPYGLFSSCAKNNPLSCLRQLIDDNLATIMDMPGKKGTGALTTVERNDMATYLLSVPYPPAPMRPYDNKLTQKAQKGFALWHVEGDHNPRNFPLNQATSGFNQPTVCGDCHRLPFGSSARSPEPANGLKATTYRGASDRFLTHVQGRSSIIAFPWFWKIADEGRDEFAIWQMSWSGDGGPRYRFDPVWDMMLEGSTGYAGAFARQLTISSEPATYLHQDLVSALEEAGNQGAVVLEVNGAFLDGTNIKVVDLQYSNNVYVDKNSKRSYTRSELVQQAVQGKFIGTFTAHHGARADVDSPQPALWGAGSIDDQRRQNFPTVTSGRLSMTVSGRHFKEDALIYVDGKRVSGSISIGMFERMSITLAQLPSPGMHFLEVQAPEGMFSNDFIFYAKE